MGSKGGKPKMPVVRYYMSQWLGLCHAPIEAITRIRHGEKVAWQGYAPTDALLTVNAMDLHGGDKKEGGVSGLVQIMSGAQGQVLPAQISRRIDNSVPVGQLPAARGVVTAFFAGVGSDAASLGINGWASTPTAAQAETYRSMFIANSFSFAGFVRAAATASMQEQYGRTGFYWGANTPYLKPTEISVTSIPIGLGTLHSRISNPVNLKTFIAIGMDVSTSTTTTVFNNMKLAMDQYLETLIQRVTDGEEIAIVLSTTSNTSTFYSALTLADIVSLRAWVAGRTRTSTPNYLNAFQPLINFIGAEMRRSDPTSDRKTIVFLTSSNATGTTLNDTVRLLGELAGDTGGLPPVRPISMNRIDTSYLNDIANTANDVISVTTSAVDSIFNAIVEDSDDGQCANPAHIIFDVETNESYGRARPLGTIDIQSFRDAAATLHAEGFGLSLLWANQSDFETFVNDILGHINGMLFTHPASGLRTLKLIRDDTDYETIREVNPDNCRIGAFSRRSWAETINQVDLTWTNPVTEMEENVTVHDLGNIATQGEIVSDSKNFYGIRNSKLAVQVASRELRIGSTPLASVEIMADRWAWDVVPGDVLRFRWPELRIEELFLRVMNVDYGKGGRSAITITAVEDVFAYNIGDFTVVQNTQWKPVDSRPTPMTYRRLSSMPTIFAAGVAQVSPFDLDPANTYALILANHVSSDVDDFNLLYETLDAGNNVVWEERGTIVSSGWFTLDEELPAEARSSFESMPLVTGIGPRVGGFVFIGTVEAIEEIAEIESVDVGEWVWKRGVLDTTPKTWPIGTQCWFMATDSLMYDATALAPGEEVTYRMLTNTSKATLPFSEAPEDVVTLTNRPQRPSRPADVRAGGTPFGPHDNGGIPSIDVTWANRNRLLEDTTILAWDDPTVTPEDGQTTTVEMIDPSSEAVLFSAAGLTSTSLPLDLSIAEGLPAVLVRVSSERDGLMSLQSHSIRIENFAPSLNFVFDGTPYTPPAADEMNFVFED